MYKTMIAGITALAMTATSATAQDRQQDDIGKLLFGLVAVAALGSFISNQNKAAPEKVHQPMMTHIPRAPVVRDAPRRGDVINPRAHRDHIVNPRRSHQPPVHQPRRNPDWNPREAKFLPRNCLQNVQTRRGERALFIRSCLNQQFRYVSTLPAKCETTVRTWDGRRFGWDPKCMWAEGYHTTRRN